MEEQVFLDQDGVMVTNKRYVFQSGGKPKTIAVSSINSVASQKIDNAFRSFFSIVFAISGIALILGSEHLVVGFLFLGFSFLIFILLKPWHVVLTVSSSGTTTRYRSKDESLVNGVLNALNEAIVKN